MKQLNIAVAGTGYVGLSIATLLAQHHREHTGEDQKRCRRADGAGNGRGCDSGEGGENQ